MPRSLAPSFALALALAVALALPLTAQEKLVESIEVRVVNVDVVVTDRSGNPVPGLKADDFEILENGKPQKITNFYEVKSNAAPELAVSASTTPAPATPASVADTAPVPDDVRARRFVFLVDNYSLQPAQRNSALKAMQKFVDKEMKPGDEASLILWQKTAQIITPLTADKAEMKRGLDSLSEHSRFGQGVAQDEDAVRTECSHELQEGIDRTIPMSQAWFLCQGAVKSFADTQWGNGKSFMTDMKDIVARLAGIDGRKILVVAGGSLPERPGREIMMWAFQQFEPYLKLNFGRAFNESNSLSQTLSIVETARFANANGVVFYMIDAHDQRDTTSAENPRMAADTTSAFSAFTNTAMAYKALADITGGSVLTSTQNFDAAFQTLARDLSTYYSIGYRPDEGSSADRKLTVRVKKQGLVARARQSYTPKSSDQEMSDRVIANVFHHGATGEWPVTVSAGSPQKDGDTYKVPLTIAMDPKLTLLPQDQKLVGGFMLYLVVGTKQGALSKVSKTARKVEMPPEAEAQLRAKPMTYTLMLTMRPGDNIVSVAVVDQVSNVAGFARADVMVQ